VAGEVDNGLDHGRQEIAAPKVEESIDAVQTTRQGTDAQEAAQTQAAWGNENGPQYFRECVINMFSRASELLSAENDLIRDFEVAVSQATEDALAAENDATVALTAVTERLDALDHSEASINLSDKMSKMGFTPTRLVYDQQTGETTEYHFVNGEWKSKTQEAAEAAAEAAQNAPISGQPSDF
jgi:hypothetical protein